MPAVTARIPIPDEGLSLLRNYAAADERSYAKRREQEMQIGEPLRTIVVEPLELPVKQPAKKPEPIYVPDLEPELVPVAQ